MHGRGKLAASPGSSGSDGGGSVSVPISASAGRGPGGAADLYRTASSGTPSKWRNRAAAASPTRRLAQLTACAVAVVLCYQWTSGGTPSSGRPPLLASQEQQGLLLERQQQQVAATQSADHQQQQQQEQPKQDPNHQQQQQVAQPENHDSAVATGAAAADDAASLPLATAEALRKQQEAIRAHNARHARAQQLAAQNYSGPLTAAPPKVALLFLVRGNMPLEPLWREFFAAAAEVEPVALPPAFSASTALERRHRRTLTQQEQQQPGEQQAHEQQSGAQEQQQQQQEEGTHDEVQQQTLQGGAAAEAGQAAGGGDGGGGGSDWPPPTEFQLKQAAANKRLTAALVEGEVTVRAIEESEDATTLAAPSSMHSPVDPEGVIARQDLFSTYVHTLPGFYYPNASIFAGYQIGRRVYVRWGQYSVAEAERRLIWAALQEPRNQRFLFISETCAPLYPPHVFYLQLLSETCSRVNACPPPNGGTVDRWHSSLYIPGVLDPPRWRKSSQWKALTRSHAELAVSDRRLAPRFERECYSYLPPKVPQPPYVAAQHRNWVQRTCVSDEHYIPTLLAVHKLDAETTCTDSLTAAEWVAASWSPVVHTGEDVTPEWLARLRKEQWSDVDCAAAEAFASAATLFRRRGAAATLAGQPVPAAAASVGAAGENQGRRRLQVQEQQQDVQQQQGADVARQQRSMQQAHQGYAPLSAKCYLLARKFSPDAVPALLALARDCQHGTAISAACLPGAAAGS